MPIFVAPDVLNENLLTSIRYIIDSRLKYFIASLVQKQIRSKTAVSKPAADLLALQVKNKAPTELDDQNLIAPFVDSWETPNKTLNHLNEDNRSSSSSIANYKRKHCDIEKEEEGRMDNDNDFPFDMNERLRRLSARVCSCSTSFEVSKDGTQFLQIQSTNTETSSDASLSSSTGISDTVIVCLPLSLSATATFDISIKHGLRTNLTFTTTGTIQGMFHYRYFFSF